MRTVVAAISLTWLCKAKAMLKHVKAWAESAIPISPAARLTCADITVNASHAPPMVRLATSAFAAVSSTTPALIGCNAAQKPILEAIASLNAQETLVTSAWTISTAVMECTARMMVAAVRKRLKRCSSE